MPGYWIQNCFEKQYDERTFDVDGGTTETIGGRTLTVRYFPLAKATPASEIQILRNLEIAVTRRRRAREPEERRGGGAGA